MRKDDLPVGAALNGNRVKYTILSLRLDLESAFNGRIDLLLPSGFRDQDGGTSYPLPTRTSELQRLITIPVPPYHKNAGCLYIKRAISELKRRNTRRLSALHDIPLREQRVMVAQRQFNQTMSEMKKKAEAAVDGVKQQAEVAIAGLNDLFALGRRGIEGQMKAHLENSEWQGEKISASAFRDCFRMVTQAVKGLGLPSEQRGSAQQAIMDELAASIKDTQETVGLAADAPPPSEVEH